MGIFHKVLEMIKDHRCPECYGSGECNDADFGDISFNTWTCESCKGNGFKKHATFNHLMRHIRKIML